MIHELHELLARAAKRWGRLRLWSNLASCWLAWAAAMVALERWSSPAIWGQPLAAALLAAAILASAGLCVRAARRAASDRRAVARKIEAVHPELATMLLAALDEAPQPRFKRLSYLQSALLAEAVAHGRTHRWEAAVPRGRLWLARLAHLAALAALGLTAAGFFTRTRAAARVDAELDARGVMTGPLTVTVEPGDVEVERGTSLAVVARFRGSAPDEGELAWWPADEASSRDPHRSPPADDAANRLAMSRSLADPQFVGRLAAVERNLDYMATLGAQRSPVYRVTVFDYPDLIRCDARLKFPKYAALPDKQIDDVQQVTAVEGTELTLSFKLNKPVREARLVDADGAVVELSPVEGDAPLYRTMLTVTTTRRFKLHLLDDQDRANKLPPTITVTATVNEPPKIELERPGRDTRVSPIEELHVGVRLTDDFGLLARGVSYALAGQPWQEAALSKATAADVSPVEAPPADGAVNPRQQALDAVVELEQLGVEPRQVISYYAWAEDYGPDGEVRRTLSDIFFAEVRPFEEIFRESDSSAAPPPESSQQGAPGGPSQELAELQKQIAAGVWNVWRREQRAEVTPQFADDAATLAQSQRQAIEQAEAMKAEAPQPALRELLDRAITQMTSAAQEIDAAASAEAAAPLAAALTAAQAAYQTLLGLRSPQFNVARSQPGQAGQGGAASSLQRQLNELELSNDRNRYETRRQAQAQQNNAQQLDQSRQLLDRLRDLARRQEDLNERVRELQAALAAAPDESRRQELERQLKRLRDQQRQILQDADALDNDMQTAPNRQQLAPAQEQLDDARSRAQQAAEALDQGNLAQAAAQGARAEQQLNRLRDDLRGQAAQQFGDQLRQLRRQARQLDQRQQELSRQLEEETQQRSLRADDHRQSLAEGLKQQRRQLGETLEQVRETVAAAEEPEPLLARELYDAAREVDQSQADPALDVARQLAEAGALQQAGEALRQAGPGISRLREGMERAAQSVLGSETEALRRADQELRDLGEQLAAERSQSERPDDEQPSGEEGDAPGASNPTSPRQDEPASGSRQGSAQPRGDEQGTGEQRGAAPPDQTQRGAAEGGEAEGGAPTDDADEAAPTALAASPREADGGGGGGSPSLENLAELLRGAGQPRGPITGSSFRDWSRRMRDVEEMLDDAELSGEAARIRDRVEQARLDYVRQSAPPQWPELDETVVEPLAELRRKIGDALRRRESPDALAPVDRDAAPAELAEQVRRYYEQLGRDRRAAP